MAAAEPAPGAGRLEFPLVELRVLLVTPQRLHTALFGGAGPYGLNTSVTNRVNALGAGMLRLLTEAAQAAACARPVAQLAARRLGVSVPPRPGATFVATAGGGLRLCSGV